MAAMRMRYAASPPRISIEAPPSSRSSVSAAELAVVPAGDFLRYDLQHHPLWCAVAGCTRPGRGFTPRLGHTRKRRPDGVLTLDDLAMAAHHDPAQLGISIPRLDHQRDLGVAPDVHDLLRLGVGGHVEGAVLG